MTIDVVLVAWLVGSLLFLLSIEAFTVARGLPTISARVQDLGQKAAIIVIWASFAAGYLLCHFFDQWAARP